MANPLSVQPAYRGPVYSIRNVWYNAHEGGRAFKIEARGSLPQYGPRTGRE